MYIHSMERQEQGKFYSTFKCLTCQKISSLYAQVGWRQFGVNHFKKGGITKSLVPGVFSLR